MKTKLLSIFVIIMFINYYSFGQTFNWGTITTYNQTNIDAGSLTSGELTTAEKNQIKDNLMASYNGLTYISEATWQYNCHNYAWFYTEQYPNNKYWVNNPENNWYDYSYLQTSSEQYPGKVTYSSTNGTLSHSAITTSTSGRYKSKWAQACLFEHDYDECPYYRDYGDTARRYYGRFVLGPYQNYIMCENSYYTIPSTPTGLYSITWSTNENLNIENYSNSQVEISPAGDGQGIVVGSAYRTGYLSRHYEYAYNTVFNSPTSAPTDINSTELCTNSEVDFWVVDNTNPPSQTTYSWDLWDGDGVIINGQGSTRITVATGGTGYLPITVTATTNCGESDWYFEEFYIDYCGEKLSFALSPNPTTDILKITTQFDVSDKPTVEIFSSKMIKVKLFTLNETEYTLNVSDLPKGVYFVIVNHKEHRSVQKFIKN